jgi:hypothetical protein
MTAAGNELFGIRPLANCPQLFATNGQFICTYATQQHKSFSDKGGKFLKIRNI